MNGGWGISYEIALRWMPLDLTDDKSTSVQVMAWCRQATSHHLSQCWSRSMSSNVITRPQWVNKLKQVSNFIPGKSLLQITQINQASDLYNQLRTVPPSQGTSMGAFITKHLQQIASDYFWMGTSRIAIHHYRKNKLLNAFSLFTHSHLGDFNKIL